MVAALKRMARAVSPAPVRTAWGDIYGRVKIRRARKVFDRDAVTHQPAFLPVDELSALMQGGYSPPDVIRYDPAGLVERAAKKIEQLTKVIDLTRVRTALELGCWDGMVSADLSKRGIMALGLDVATKGIDRRAREDGACFVQSDAEAIGVRSEAVDLVYSFASFEHFPHPDRCMKEVHRVLRSGGSAFIHFGPLYFSPYGLHAYRQIPVPFCHLLFHEEDLHRWAADHNLPHEWPFVNGWTLKRYRELWRSLESLFVVTAYRVYTTGGVGLELVNRYPGCFVPRVEDFDELLVAFVDIALQKS
jgi:SAM-dependent methyltransferase